MQSSPDPTPPQTNPYGLALFVAQSLGKALPIVVIIALIAIGSWYFVKELSALQTELIDAERRLATARVDQAKAESAAQSAIDKARGEIMAEQAKQLGQLNDTSVAVSKKIQDLVSGQIENMGRIEETSKAQLGAALAQQKAAEAEAKKEIAGLRQQLEQLELRRKSIEADIANSGYQEIKTKLMEQLARGYYFSSSDPILDLLKPRLSDLQLRPLIVADMQDTRINWRYRLLLLVEMYRLSGDEALVTQMSALLDSNKSALDNSTGRIFQGRSRWSSIAEENLAKLSIRWILDETAPVAARVSFFDLLPLGNSLDRLTWSANFADRNQTAKALGRLLIAAVEIGEYCAYPMDLLGRFSDEALDAVTTHLLASAKYSKGHECLTEYYKRSKGQLPRSDDATIQRWVSQ